MKYANTQMFNNIERVAVALPLSAVPLFNPENPHPNTYAVPDDVKVGWIRDALTGEFNPPAPSALSVTKLLSLFTAAVQERLDTFAREKGYESILSACSYVASTNPIFRAEAEYCVEVRDNTWVKCHELTAQVLSGQLPVSGIDALLAMMPEMVWAAT